jgi:8-oxo-dGTP pyrophosphatase MutT (NUDIX family)
LDSAAVVLARTGSRAAVLRRSAPTRLPSASDDKVGGLRARSAASGSDRSCNFLRNDDHVLVVGVTEHGGHAFEVLLDHGADPDVLAFDQGYVVLRPLDASRAGSGELILRLLVRPVVDEPRPEVRRQDRDAGLVLGDDVRPAVRQRFAAYAVVTSSRGLLATEYSDRTAVTGRWGMPGGGLDDHEPPTSAVLREVAEETSQEIILGELIKVQTSHWVGRSPYGTIEDFHAVRLIYRASCPHPTEPVVLDEGGTTESAQWVPLESWRSVSWTQNWQLLLSDLLNESRAG